MDTLLDRLGRYLWPLAVANLVANIGIVVTGAARAVKLSSGSSSKERAAASSAFS